MGVGRVAPLLADDEEPHADEGEDAEAEQLRDQADLEDLLAPRCLVGVAREVLALLAVVVGACDRGDAEELDQEGEEVKCYEDGRDQAGRDPEMLEVAARLGRDVPYKAPEGHVASCCDEGWCKDDEKVVDEESPDTS